MTIGELIFEVGFKADTMKLKDFGRAVGDLNLTSIMAGVNFASLYEGAKKLIDIAHGMGDSVADVSEVMDINSEALQKWQGAATQAGVATNVVTDAIVGLQKVNDLLKAGKTDQVNALYTYFLPPKEILDQTEDATVKFTHLMESAQKMAVTNPGRVRALFNSLGIDPEAMRILKEIPNIPQNLASQPFISKEDLNLINKNMELLHTTSRDLNLLWANFGSSILPGINSALESINKTLGHMQLSPDMKNLLGFIGRVSGGIGGAISLFGKGLGIAANLGMTGTLNGRGVNPLSNLLAGLNDQPFNYSGNNPENSVFSKEFYAPSLNPARVSGAPSKTNNVTQNNTINVNGATDPQAVAQAVDAQIGKHINQALASGSTDSR